MLSRSQPPSVDEVEQLLDDAENPSKSTNDSKNSPTNCSLSIPTTISPKRWSMQ